MSKRRRPLDLRARTYIEFEKTAWKFEGDGYVFRYFRNGILKHSESGFSTRDIEKVVHLLRAAGIEVEEFKNGSVAKPQFRSHASRLKTVGKS